MRSWRNSAMQECSQLSEEEISALREEDPDKCVYLGMIKGRHNITECEDYIFTKDIRNPMDIQFLHEEANESLRPIISRMKREGRDTIVLYVTGLTPALIEIQNICTASGIRLIYKHYNKAYKPDVDDPSEKYVTQYAYCEYTQPTVYKYDSAGELLAVI